MGPYSVDEDNPSLYKKIPYGYLRDVEDKFKLVLLKRPKCEIKYEREWWQTFSPFLSMGYGHVVEKVKNPTVLKEKAKYGGTT